MLWVSTSFPLDAVSSVQWWLIKHADIYLPVDSQQGNHIM